MQISCLKSINLHIKNQYYWFKLLLADFIFLFPVSLQNFKVITNHIFGKISRYLFCVNWNPKYFSSMNYVILTCEPRKAPEIGKFSWKSHWTKFGSKSFKNYGNTFCMGQLNWYASYILLCVLSDLDPNNCCLIHWVVNGPNLITKI